MHDVLRGPSAGSVSHPRPGIAEYGRLAGYLAQGVGGTIVVYDIARAVLIALGRG